MEVFVEFGEIADVDCLAADCGEDVDELLASVGVSCPGGGEIGRGASGGAIAADVSQD